jgi:hypothetical protein
MLDRDETVTVILLFDCRTELNYQDPKRNPGDPSQICTGTVHTLHECMPQLLLASRIQNQSESVHQYESKNFGVQYSLSSSRSTL